MDGKNERQGLLTNDHERNGYGSSSSSGKNGHFNRQRSFQVRSGYSLSPSGLSNMVTHSQFGFLDVYGGAFKLAQAIGCKDPANGFSDHFDFDEQKDKYGSNEMELPPEPSFCALIYEGLQDVTLLMLICSACVSLFLGLVIEKDYEHGWIEGVSILGSVCIVLNVAAVTDYSKAYEFREQQLDLEKEKKVHVVRGGKSVVMHPRNLVVGDVIRLAVGDIVPCDGVLLDASDLSMDESALTGETNLIKKGVYDPSVAKPLNPFIVSGTNVMHGSGKMIVTAVGKNSMQGKILARIREQQDSPIKTQKSGDEDTITDPGAESGGSCCFCFSMSSIREFFTFGLTDDGGDLMEKLDILAVDIGKGGMIVAGLVFLVMILRWSYREWLMGDGCDDGSTEALCRTLTKCSWNPDTEVCSRTWRATDLSTVLKFFITAITILVVAVPEGLPLAVTLSLAISMRRMTRDNNQVKHMDSCETMGSATTICSDKTGTLTENKMTVMRAYVGEKEYVHTAGSKYSSIAEVMQSGQVSKKLTRIICEATILNSASTSHVSLNAGKWTYEGNATECALLKMAYQLGYDAEPLRKSYKEDGSQLDWGVFTVPFSSERKRMAWVVRLKSTEDVRYRLYIKGAPDKVLEVSSEILSSSKPKLSTSKLTEKGRQTLMEKMDKFQKAGMRTLAVGYRDFAEEPSGGWSNQAVEKDIVFLALYGIEDPLRPSVPKAIQKCCKAGIDVRMCTGDALETGIAIARQCGILRASDFVEDGRPKRNFAMTGAEFDERIHIKDTTKPKIVRRVFDFDSNETLEVEAHPFALDGSGNKILNQNAFDEVWPTLRVLARCQPEDKLALVRGLRSSKVFLDTERCNKLREEHDIHIFPDFQVVAVTGDGTNDAPALKSADVGFAMGIVGTETAKQACDIILLDDNFSSIVKAAMWGRNVFDSISKFIQFQLTVNLVAITLAVVGAFSYNESPLSAVQMLWVNMIMDSLASLALATELPTEKLLDRPPYGKRRKVISNIMRCNIVGQGLYQMVVLILVLFHPDMIPIEPPIKYEPEPGSVHWSLFFNVFVWLQLFNELNSRKLQTIDGLKNDWSEWNVFSGILQNRMFVLVVGSTVILQVVIVQFGGVSVSIVEGGLTLSQWQLSIFFGVLSLLWQWVINVFIVTFMPSEEASLAEVSDEDFFLRQDGMERSASYMTTRTSTSKIPEDQWEKLRLDLRYGRVYARAFGMSLRSGVNLRGRTYAKTKNFELNRENSMAQVAKQVSSEFIGSEAF